MDQLEEFEVRHSVCFLTRQLHQRTVQRNRQIGRLREDGEELEGIRMRLVFRRGDCGRRPDDLSTVLRSHWQKYNHHRVYSLLRVLLPRPQRPSRNRDTAFRR